MTGNIREPEDIMIDAALPERWQKLKELAEKATYKADEVQLAAFDNKANAAYIAAANPVAILALLAELYVTRLKLEAQREYNKALSREVERLEVDLMELEEAE